MAQDAVALIKADHRKVEQLFREFEEAGDRAYKTKRQLVEQITRELEVHAAIEEETYYPAVEAKARKDGRELVAEAVEEHHVVKVLLGELASMSAEDEAFDAKVTVLMENVRHHVEEEEQEMLPQSEKVLGDEELTAWARRWRPASGSSTPARSRGLLGPPPAYTDWTVAEREVDRRWPMARPRASGSTVS